MLMYELGFQKLLTHGHTKPRASCVRPGPGCVRYGTGVSLGWGTLSGGCVQLDSGGGSAASTGMMLLGFH